MKFKLKSTATNAISNFRNFKCESILNECTIANLIAHGLKLSFFLLFLKSNVQQQLTYAKMLLHLFVSGGVISESKMFLIGTLPFRWNSLSLLMLLLS